VFPRLSNVRRVALIDTFILIVNPINRGASQNVVLIKRFVSNLIYNLPESLQRRDFHLPESLQRRDFLTYYGGI
jgi:hypothetical protein